MSDPDRRGIEENTFLNWLGLGRTEATSGNFNQLSALLIDGAERERTGLVGAIAAILEVAEVIALDSIVLHNASRIQIDSL